VLVQHVLTRASRISQVGFDAFPLAVV